MIIECIPTGMFESNTYLVGQNGMGIIIDCGVEAEEILAVVQKHQLKAEYLFLTHGHIDHICSVDRLRELLPVKVAIQEEDAEGLANPVYNASALFGRSFSYKPADLLLKGGECIEIGGMKVDIIHTPGHTPGCICIKIGEHVFSGDTLFRFGIGRTDLGYGNHTDILRSIKTGLMTLDDRTEVYPGHGEATTIGQERKNNPYVR
jgi:hydroxyacylglutathione hydrolase